MKNSVKSTFNRTLRILSSFGLAVVLAFGTVSFVPYTVYAAVSVTADTIRVGLSNSILWTESKFTTRYEGYTFIYNDKSYTATEFFNNFKGMDFATNFAKVVDKKVLVTLREGNLTAQSEATIQPMVVAPQPTIIPSDIASQSVENLPLIPIAATAVESQTMGVPSIVSEISVSQPAEAVEQPVINTTSQQALPTDKEVYDVIMAMQEQYPEGMSWTNDNEYKGSRGCSAFARIICDAITDKYGQRQQYVYKSFESLRVGDCVRINNNSHYVVVIGVSDGIVTVAEGNYDSTIHWGRTFTLEQIKEVANHVSTYYPQ